MGAKKEENKTLLQCIRGYDVRNIMWMKRENNECRLYATPGVNLPGFMLDCCFIKSPFLLFPPLLFIKAEEEEEKISNSADCSELPGRFCFFFFSLSTRQK